MAEDAGIDRVVVVDHVVMGANTDAYRWGRFPTAPDAPWLEPLTMLTGLAAVTSTVRLATGVIIPALRGAPLLAKTAATLDVMSQGRLELGVGLGLAARGVRRVGARLVPARRAAHRHARRLPGAVVRLAGELRVRDGAVRRRLVLAPAGAARWRARSGSPAR